MTNALRIAELPAGNHGGLIGVALADGPPQAEGLAFDAVADWGAVAVVTVTETDALARDRISGIGEAVRTRFMEWHPLPLGDAAGPDAAFEAAWPRHSARLRSVIGAGNRVLIHGQAGMVAARVLVEMGTDPEAAIAAVSRVGDPRVLETGAWQAWVREGRRPTSGPPDGTGARDRAVGALLGLAVGDAVGTTLEFSAKPARAVLSDMVGGGPFGLEAGQWTDDTAMALALCDSLTAHPDLDPGDLMRRFVSWHRQGTYSCTGRCFDIGATTATALHRFERTGEPFAGSDDPRTAGNGSIMRLAPVALRHWRDPAAMLRIARDQSRTTHAAPEVIASCEILADLLAASIRGTTLPDLVASEAAGRVRGFRVGQVRHEVRGTGYVVASLHAALWAVSRTSTVRDAVLLAANLGEDADTTAAVAGQIAGGLYGAEGIPDAWRRRLAWGERIERVAGALFDAGSDRPAA
ncbi:ADP-ribosylglycohydrolase family protein [Methylobacterium oryzisoli]|uniref:ADP-ribosylglycohydrolase family protein n=1 Tax=Methylobacterium oryzisoli TaxID=3385502 RepID=UPI003891573D